MTTTLVFPGGMAAGLAYRERAHASAHRVIGASSLATDPAQRYYDDWFSLPFVTEPGFDAALAALVRQNRVTSVYTPHFVVWDYLSERLAAIAPGTQLVDCRFPQDEERDYRSLRERVAGLHTPSLGPSARAPLTLLERTGLIRLVGAIPGQCGEAKMAAIIEIMRHVPAGGDIVEIGSWWGRSAALLVLLSKHFKLGSVLCVDPWASVELAQGNALLDGTSAKLDTEEALRIFEINLSPLAGGRLNVLRARSDDAALQYRPGLVIQTPAFGTVRYTGRIAILHIDGNHSHGQAARDTAAWAPWLLPGGWIIFDDYEWAFGDGPREAADAFVAAQGSRVATCFQAGPALMVQLSDDGARSAP